MSEELVQQIAKVAELKGNADLEDPKKGNALLNEVLEEFYPQDTVRLKHLRKALNTTAKVGWDVLIQARPAQMVDICANFIESGTDTPKKAPKKTPKKKGPTKKPDDGESTSEKEPRKRRSVRRLKEEAATDESQEAPKTPTKKSAAKAVVSDIPAIKEYIDEKSDRLDKALLDVASAADIRNFREVMLDEHARTRSMLQALYGAIYKMIVDEDFVPPPELDEG